MTKKMLIALPLAVAMLAGAAPAVAAAPSRVLTFEAEPGARPVDGRSGHWTAPGDEIEVRGTASVVKLDAVAADGDDLWVELRGANGAPLRRGVYRTDAAARPDGPRMLVVSRGIGCSDDHARFAITRIRRDAAGRVTVLDLRFEHRCGSATAPALRGQLRYRA